MKSDPKLSAEFEALPPEVQAVIESFQEWDGTYDECEELRRRLAAVGWTCDYDLGAQPIDFKPITANETTKE
jgi:hypothetical protein